MNMYLKEEEEKFLLDQKIRFPALTSDDIKVKWITFLYHEEMTSQGDIYKHLHLSHRMNINNLEDEKKITTNKKCKLVLSEAKNIKNLTVFWTMTEEEIWTE